MTHPTVSAVCPWARCDHFGVGWKLVFHYVCTVGLLITGKTICQWTERRLRLALLLASWVLCSTGLGVGTIYRLTEDRALPKRENWRIVNDGIGPRVEESFEVRSVESHKPEGESWGQQVGLRTPVNAVIHKSFISLASLAFPVTKLASFIIWSGRVS